MYRRDFFVYNIYGLIIKYIYYRFASVIYSDFSASKESDRCNQDIYFLD